MASRLVVLRQRVTTALHSAFEAFEGRIAQALDERVAPFLEEGESTFDFLHLQRILGRMVEASRDRMIRADKAHAGELVGDVEPRLERKRWLEALRAKLIDVRRIFQGLLGLERAGRIVAVDGGTAREPELLWRQGDDTLSILRSSELEMPEVSTAAVDFDPLKLAEELEPLVTGLRKSIDAVGVEQRTAADSLKEKQDSIADHDVLVAACGRILSGFYLLAGRPDLARRIRISLPRRSRQQAPEEDAPGAETPAAETPAAEAPTSEERPSEAKADASATT